MMSVIAVRDGAIGFPTWIRRRTAAGSNQTRAITTWAAPPTAWHRTPTYRRAPGRARGVAGTRWDEALAGGAARTTDVGRSGVVSAWHANDVHRGQCIAFRSAGGRQRRPVGP